MSYKNAKFKSRLVLILYLLVGFSAITYFVNKEKDLNSNVPQIEIDDNVNNSEKEFRVIRELNNSSKEDIKNNKVSLNVDVEVSDNLSSREYANISSEIQRTVKMKNSGKELNNLTINYSNNKGEKLHTYKFEGK